ncbi:hypothetical protein M2277_005667 [Paenibacillus sp. LBL]|nr:hypothetical protein [Paenibacillus sp. LBL]
MRHKHLFEAGLRELKEEFHLDLNPAIEAGILVECTKYENDTLVMTERRATNIVLLVLSLNKLVG